MKVVNIEMVCAVCERREVEKWCDYIVEYDRSIKFYRSRKSYNEQFKSMHTPCSLPMCKECAVSMGADLDMCPQHANAHNQHSALKNDKQKARAAKERFKMMGGWT